MRALNLAAAVGLALVSALNGSGRAAPAPAEDPVLWQKLEAADKDNDGRLVPREFDGVGGSALWSADGLTYDRADPRPDDGTHPALVGRQKVAAQLLAFLKSDSTARIWFLAGSK
jgi:hypothetical protein